MHTKHEFAPHVITDPVEAVRAVVYGRHALEACAKAVGVSHQVLSRQLNAEDDSTHLPAQRAAAIADFMDSDALAECHAARRGGLFVKLPPVPASGERELTASFAKLVREFSEVAQAFSKAVTDGSVFADEVDVLEKELRDVYATGEVLVRVARAKAARR